MNRGSGGFQSPIPSPRGEQGAPRPAQPMAQLRAQLNIQPSPTGFMEKAKQSWRDFTSDVKDGVTVFRYWVNSKLKQVGIGPYIGDHRLEQHDARAARNVHERRNAREHGMDHIPPGPDGFDRQLRLLQQAGNGNLVRQVSLGAHSVSGDFHSLAMGDVPPPSPEDSRLADGPSNTRSPQPSPSTLPNSSPTNLEHSRQSAASPPPQPAPAAPGYWEVQMRPIGETRSSAPTTPRSGRG